MSRVALIGAVAVGMFLFAAPAFAQVCDPKTEKCPPCDPKTEKCELTCSPGFWKTHLPEGPGQNRDLCSVIPPTGISCPGLACDPACTCADLLTVLNTGGGGAIATDRQEAADCLNAFFASILPPDVCVDEATE